MGEIFIFDGQPTTLSISTDTGYQVDETKSVEEQEKDPAFDRDKFSSLRAKFASGR